MVRSFAMDKPPLQIISERENIYRLLSGTSDENLHKKHAAYTINPSTRYKNITQKKIREVYHLYDTDDPVNADFSLGSPTGATASKGKERRMGMGEGDGVGRGDGEGRGEGRGDSKREDGGRRNS